MQIEIGEERGVLACYSRKLYTFFTRWRSHRCQLYPSSISCCSLLLSTGFGLSTVFKLAATTDRKLMPSPFLVQQFFKELKNFNFVRYNFHIVFFFFFLARIMRIIFHFCLNEAILFFLESCLIIQVIIFFFYQVMKTWSYLACVLV